MKDLLIKDLSLAAELDDAALSAIQGGSGYYMPKDCFPSYPKQDIDFNASQMLGQSQSTTVNNGNCVAFANCIDANVNPSQHGANTINFGK